MVVDGSLEFKTITCVSRMKTAMTKRSLTVEAPPLPPAAKILTTPMNRLLYHLP